MVLKDFNIFMMDILMLIYQQFVWKGDHGKIYLMKC